MRLDPPRSTGPPKTKRNGEHNRLSSPTSINQARSNHLSYCRSSAVSSSFSSSCSSSSSFIEEDRSHRHEPKTTSTTASNVTTDSSSYDVCKHDATRENKDQEIPGSSSHSPKCNTCHADHDSTPRWRNSRRRSILARRGLIKKSYLDVDAIETPSVSPFTSQSPSSYQDVSSLNLLARVVFNENERRCNTNDYIDNMENLWQKIVATRVGENDDNDEIVGQDQGRENVFADGEARGERSALGNGLPETTTCLDVPGGRLYRRPKEHPARVSSTELDRSVGEDSAQSKGRTRWSTEGSHAYDVYGDRRCRSHHCRHKVDASINGDAIETAETPKKRDNRTAHSAKPITRRRRKRRRRRRRRKSKTPDANEVDVVTEDKRTRKFRQCRQQQRSRSYRLLLVLYLLVLPILYATNSSGQIALALAQNAPLAHAQDFGQPHNSNSSSSSTLSTHIEGVTRHQDIPDNPQGHPYNEYAWEVNQINPWLSACDLAGPAPADLQGSCGPPEVPKNCPAPCESRSRDSNAFTEVIEHLEVAQRYEAEADRKTTGDGGEPPADYGPGEHTAPEQCLFYLEESHKRDICRDEFGQETRKSFLTPRENRYWFMSGLRLRHCCEHAVVNALAPGRGGPLEDVLNGGEKCAEALDKLLVVDALAARLHCEFEEVLARYDCAQHYSVIHNCTHCKEAYRKWVCSSLVPYFAHGGPLDLDASRNTRIDVRLRPCRSFCQSVEQRCPYLLPGDRAPAYPTQYAGEPTFLCTDPNIPETGEQASRALHGNENKECCFRVCHEKQPGLGICANCTDRELRKRGADHDSPTAPHCEITAAPFQSGPAGQPQQQQRQQGSIRTFSSEVTLTEPSAFVPTTSANTEQGNSFCGSGGVGSMSSSSSSSSSSQVVPSLPLACFFWVWGVLISVSTSKLAGPWPWSVRWHRRSSESTSGLAIVQDALRCSRTTCCTVFFGCFPVGSVARGVSRMIAAKLKGAASGIIVKWWCWWRRRCRGDLNDGIRADRLTGRRRDRRPHRRRRRRKGAQANRA